MSGLDLVDGSQIRKGAGSAVLAWLEGTGVEVTPAIRAQLTSETDAIGRSPAAPRSSSRRRAARRSDRATCSASST